MNQYQTNIKRNEKYLEYALRNSKLFNQNNFKNIVDKISYYPNNIHEMNYGDSLLKFSDSNNLYLFKKDNDLIFFLDNFIYVPFGDVNSLKIEYSKNKELLDEYREDKSHLSHCMWSYNYDCETMIEEECILEDKYESLFEELAESLDIEDLEISSNIFFSTDIKDIKMTPFGLFKKASKIISTKNELLSNCQYFDYDDCTIKTLGNLDVLYSFTKLYNDKLGIIFSLENNFDFKSVYNLKSGFFYFDNNILKKLWIHCSNVLNSEDFHKYAETYFEDIPF